MITEMYGNHPFCDAIPTSQNKSFPSDMLRTDPPEWIAAFSPYWSGSVIMIVPDGYNSRTLEEDTVLSPLDLVCYIDYLEEGEDESYILKGLDITSRDGKKHTVMRGKNEENLFLRALREADEVLGLGLKGKPVFLDGTEESTII